MDHVERNCNSFFGIQVFEDRFFLVWLDFDQVVLKPNVDRFTSSDFFERLTMFLNGKLSILS